MNSAADNAYICLIKLPHNDLLRVLIFASAFVEAEKPLYMLHLFVFLAWCSQTVIAGTTALVPTAFSGGNPDVCQVWKNMTKEEICDYVNYHDDICEGGGYLLWSQYVECQFDVGKRIGVITAGVVWMLMLFVMVSTTADDFFSPNVASIVAHLKISESIAGVTFMAFGNGAPDIFGSIASVLSSPKPKAGLALGELLGWWLIYM
ncbi:unnamed protein product [Strongylus vulgaris]|uniref:Sodium/calcium exchanger membrane region domain-containing protein n=1 Tax=Strongylus vulgaris TaxID=40348 RepID=A0A3P7K9W6_STRVU|nr:unnamed protein product [Strongylus vulgaris]